MPLLANAKFFKGSIKFSNGNNLSGFVQFPEPTDNFVKFKLSEDGKKEKYSIDEVEKLEIFLDNNQKVTIVALQTYSVSLFKGVSKEPSKEKFWLVLVYDGKLKIYNADVVSYSSTASPNSQSVANNSTRYYFKSPNKEYSQFVYADFGAGNAVIGGKFKYFIKAAEAYFQNDCPKFSSTIQKSDFEKGMERIGELYDSNCGKQ